MIDLGLIIARFLHYAATTTLAGVSFFPIYAYTGAEPETHATVSVARCQRSW